MNQNKTFRSFSVSKIAKSALFKLMLLSTASVLAPSAFAAEPGDYADFPKCLDINSYLHRYASIKDYLIKHDHVDENNEWTLSSNLLNVQEPAYTHLKNGRSKFELVSIKIKTMPFDTTNKFNQPAIETISCEYKDPNIAGSLYLNLEPRGRIRVGDESLGEDTVMKPTDEGYDEEAKKVHYRTVSYVSRGGQITDKAKWTYNTKAPLVTEFTCQENSKDWITQCGGWSFKRIVQNNPFWSDAYYWCNRVWQRCYENGLLWSYAKDLRAMNNTGTFDEHQVPSLADSKCNLAVKSRIERIYVEGATWTYYYCSTLNTDKTFCKDAKCTAEITAVNKIIGKDKDKDREGMASYINVCWKDRKWTENEGEKIVNKKWDKKYRSSGTSCSTVEPTGTWPSYSHLAGGQ